MPFTGPNPPLADWPVHPRRTAITNVENHSGRHHIMPGLNNIAAIAALGFVAACANIEPPAPQITFEAYEFEARNGEKIAAERGVFKVPENRSDANSRKIELGFVWFKSTSDNPGAPIIYLAGGPGGSGVATARGRRFPLFMAMREFGDVIAFDQRGTGMSNDIENCKTEHRFPLHEPLTVEKSFPLLRIAADECAAIWRAQGVDLSGYNTAESARDIDALRGGLGAEKVSLWGISYGSHLAFAALKVMPNNIDKIVLTGIEGLGDTVKLPAHTDAYFARLQEAINADPGAAAAYPDLAGLMARVHAKLDAAPVDVTFKDSSDNDVTMTVGKIEMQMLSSFTISDPFSSVRLPATYAMAEAGDFSRIAPLIYKFMRHDPISFRGMPEAMDIMSGISDARLAMVREQAKTSLLGDTLNFPMPHLIGAFGLDDLGDDFRAPVKTDVRTLILTSTLDGRTYPAAAAEAIEGFSNATQVIVENGGHNVFMQSPEISDIILRFMRGEEVANTVTLELPKFLY
jgi:pimeloyl-ACP methyl ester carboxylesterase